VLLLLLLWKTALESQSSYHGKIKLDTWKWKIDKPWEDKIMESGNTKTLMNLLLERTSAPSSPQQTLQLVNQFLARVCTSQSK
jgi:hypothetical protein